MTDQETRSACCSAVLDRYGSAFSAGDWFYCLMCGRQCDASGNLVDWRDAGSPDADFRRAIEGLEQWARFRARRSAPIYSRTDYVLAQRNAFYTGATWRERVSGLTGDNVIEYEAARIYPGPDLISLSYRAPSVLQGEPVK